MDNTSNCSQQVLTALYRLGVAGCVWLLIGVAAVHVLSYHMPIEVVLLTREASTDMLLEMHIGLGSTYIGTLRGGIEIPHYLLMIGAGAWPFADVMMRYRRYRAARLASAA